MNKQSIISLDKTKTIFLKGLAILLVIIGHMGYIYRGGAWGASLFLMLSGYGIFQSYINDNNNKYFQKKIVKVYLPYLIVTVFILLYNYIKNKITLKTIIFSVLGLDFGYICDKTMWFISFIFAEYIIFYITTVLLKKVKNDNLKHILVIILNIICNIMLLIVDKKYMIWSRGAGIFLYILSFSIGILLSKLSFISINKKINNVFSTVFLFISLLIVLVLYNNINSNFQYFAYSNLMPLTLILFVDKNIIKYGNKYINYIGIISFDLYLWEGFLLNQKNNLFSTLHNYLIIDLSTFVFCIFVCQIYKKLFVTPIINYFTKKPEIEKVKK